RFEFYGPRAPSRHLYWSDSQGRNAGRSTNPAGDQVRVRDQLANGQGARPRRTANAPRPRRRGDRVMARASFVREKRYGTAQVYNRTGYSQGRHLRARTAPWSGTKI